MSDKKNILLVEDEPIISMLHSKLVSSFGYEVITASTGEKAVEIATANERINLILMDMDLGKGIDGTETARQILTKRNIPIVFLTSHSEKEYVDKVKEITRYGYVIKNSGTFVLQSSIDMAFELFEANRKRTIDNRISITEAEMLDFSAQAQNNKFGRLDELSLIFNGMADGVLLADVETKKFAFGNKAICDMLGYEINEITKLSSYDIHPPDADFTHLLALFEKQVRKELSVVQDLPMKRKDGSAFLADVNSVPVTIGGKKYLLGVFRDASTRIKLKKMQSVRNNILNTMNSEYNISVLIEKVLAYLKESFAFDAIGVRMKKGVTYDYFKQLGFSSEFINKSNDICLRTKINKGIIEYDGACGKILFDKSNLSDTRYIKGKTFCANDSAEFVKCYPQKSFSGKPANLCKESGYESVAVISIKNEDDVSGLLHIACRRANVFDEEFLEYLESIADAIAVCIKRSMLEDLKIITCIEHNVILVVNSEGYVTYSSPKLRALFGYAENEVTGKSINQLIDPDAPEEEFIIPNQLHLIGDEAITGNVCEIMAKKKNGERFPIEISFSAIKVRNEWNAVCMVRDITERKLNEQKIESLLKEKEVLLKEVHHRIKNNMSAIGGLLLLQANASNKPEVASALNDAYSRLESMNVLYDKLYRSDNFNEISLKTYLDKLLDQILFSMPENISVEIKKEIIDIMISAKKTFAIGIIVNELMTNIVKYAFKGRDSGLVKVLSEAMDNRIVIEIEDNGVGMPEHINIENSTGFGLSLVKMMSEQIGGKVRIERNHGTKFIIEFPIS